MKGILVAVAVVIVGFRYISIDPNVPESSTIILRGTVSTEPLYSARKTTVKISGISAGVFTDQKINYGDYLELKGMYISGNLENATILLHRPSTNILHKVRRKIINFYKSNIPRDDAALVSGITLGSKELITYDFYEGLRAAGVIHVVVASGTNVVFVSAFLVNILLVFLKRRVALPISLVGVWVYVLLSGFDPPLVRASIMGSVAILAQQTGRLSSNLRNLFIACTAMLIVNPLWIEDLGFIMSVMATLGLILFESKIDRLLSILPVAIRESLSTTLAAQLGVLPILVGVFGNFNILSPLVNVLVLWTVPITMIVGAVSGIVSLASPEIAKYILFLVYPITQWFIYIVHLFE